MARARRKDIKEAESNLKCVAQGRVMTIPERNLMMKLDYINGGLTPKALSEKYGLLYEYVLRIKKEEGWDKERKAFFKKVEEETRSSLSEVYVGCKVETTLMYNNTWQKVMNLATKILDDPEKYLGRADGTYKLGSFSVLCDIIEKSQRNQLQCQGFLGAESSIKLQLQKESLEIKKKQLDIGQEEEVKEDNFIDALGGVCDDLYKEE